MTPQLRESLSSLPTEKIVALAKGQIFVTALARSQGVEPDQRTVTNMKMLMTILRERAGGR